MKRRDDMPLGVTIQDRVDVQVTLDTSVFVPSDLRKAALFLDAEGLMPDTRYVEVTASDYYAVLGGISPMARDFAAAYFSQKRKPGALQIVRWAQEGQKAYWASGPGADFSVGSGDKWGTSDMMFAGLTLQIGAEGASQVVTGDYSGVTTKEEIATVMQAAFAALETPAIEDLEKTRVFFDTSGRLVLEFSEDAPSGITVKESQVASLLDAGNSFAAKAVEGEEFADAVEALRTLDDSAHFYAMRTVNMDLSDPTEKAKNTADLISFARAVEAVEKIGLVLVHDPAAKNSGSTDDALAQLGELGFTRTAAIYFENVSDRLVQCPDAAVLGSVIPGVEGAVSFAQVDLTGVTASGYAAPLSKAQTDVIVSKGGNVIERVAGFTYLFNGSTLGGEEIRIMFGRDWFITQIRAAVFSYLMSADLAAFDAETVGVIVSIIRQYGELAIARRILVDTEERPFVVNVPDPDDFTILQRRSRKMELPQAFSGFLNSAVNEVQIVGVWAA